MRSLLFFAFGALAFGAAAIGAGYYIGETKALIQGCAAFVLTFIPALATLAWVNFSFRGTPDLQLAAGLGGHGVRLLVALGGGLFLKRTEPDTFDNAFLYWLVLFYLTFLPVEVILLVRQHARRNELHKQ